MRRDEAGFTLLEVMVAFIIAAFALAVLFEGGIGGLRAADTGRRYQEALARAQSHLEAAGVASALQPQDGQGDEGGGYHWHLRVTQAQAGSVAGPRGSQLALYTLSVRIDWAQGGTQREVALQTQRIGTAAAVAP